ncbi:MAG: ABC-three component system protein [Chthoniobacteraceae bacterium]
MPFQDSVGLLRVNGEWTGTAWIVAPGFAITARHCVSNASNAIRLIFGAMQCAAIVTDIDEQLDVALLSLEIGALHPMPLKLLACPRENVYPQPDWIAHGFPGALSDAELGVALTGKITLFRASYNGGVAMQLNCEEAGNVPNFQAATFGGMSGAPVVVNLGNEKVVAMIFEAPPVAGEHIIYATPADAIVHRFAAHLGGISIESWDGLRGIATIIRDAGGIGFTTNIDNAFVRAAWTGNLAGAWCNGRSDESPQFVSALARLLIHSPGLQATKLDLSGAQAWAVVVKAAARRWVPTRGFQADSLSHRYVWRELTVDAQPSGGVRFPDLDTLAAAIHGYCDRWVLDALRGRVDEFFAADNTQTIINYSIADDIREVMTPLWHSWRIRLESNPAVLHHFLALLLTAHGNHDFTRACAGAGPLTMENCLFRPLVFSLAVCSCMRAEIAGLKYPQPGNFGNEELPGHACGIEILDGKLFQVSLSAHRWATPIVIFPNCSSSISELRAGQKRFRERKSEPTVSIRDDLPREVVFSADSALLTAMEMGRYELVAEVQARCNELSCAQQMYVEKAEVI